MLRRTRLRSLAPLSLALVTLPLVVAPATADRPSAQREFGELTTFEVAGEVAEILATTPNGRTLLYTDSAAGEVGLVDLTRPRQPEQLGTIAVDGEPTSVAVSRHGRYGLVVVDTTEDLTQPSGNLSVVDLRTRQIITVIDLGGQPDAIAISPDGSVAAIAIENQRDEERVVAGVEGGMPQEPAGYLSVVDLKGKPSSWTAAAVDLTGLAGARYPNDPEPEFVDVNRDNVAAVTLQENNAIALVDLDRREVIGSFSAGEVTRTDADTEDDGTVAFDDELTAPREPDAVQWTPEGNLVTSDEGDLAEEPSGGRGWTVFSPTGEVLYAAGAAAEQALANEGYYPDGRSDDKGAEFEGAEVAALRGDTYAFIGAERGDAVLVYDFADEAAPELVQVLETGDAPEGLLAVNRKHLFLTSNEDDGTISIFQLGARR